MISSTESRPQLLCNTKRLPPDWHVVVVGPCDPAAVRELVGGLTEFDVVVVEADVRLLPPRWCYAVVATPAQPAGRARRFVELIRQRFPESEVRFISER